MLKLLRTVGRVRLFRFVFTMLHSDDFWKSVLIAADDALQSAVGARRTSEEVDKKFREAIHLLDRFQEDFPFKDPMSDPNIGGTVITEKEASGDESKSPSMILNALKQNLHAKVKFPSVSLFLDANES